jgi:Tol biopolymer transport system component/peroxiredoxin
LNESLRQAAAKGDIEQVRLLISQGADVNAKRTSDGTPLRMAQRAGHKEVVELLIEHGATEPPIKPITARERANLPEALSRAVRLGDYYKVRQLVSSGADVNAKDKRGYAPLYQAARYGHKDVVELLIAKGADINAVHKDGMPALKLAEDKKHADIVELLEKHGAVGRPVVGTESPQRSASIDTQPPGRTESTPIGKTAPHFVLRDLNGKRVSLSSFKGKVVILDFWATWRPPCVVEIPHFIALHNQYKDQGFAMVGISTDRKGASVVKAFVRKHRINYPILMADSRVQAAYGGIKSIPTTFVIDSAGKIYREYIGYRDKAVFEADIKALLAGVELRAKPVQIESSQRAVTVDAKPTAEPDVITDPNAAKTRIKREIAFASRRDGNAEIYVMSTNGSEQINLTKNRAHDSRPSWSPDGTKIAFVSNRDRNYEIYVMDLDGSEQRRLTNNSAVDEYPCWSSDGAKIAFASERDGNREIYVINANGGDLRRVTNDPATDTNPCWSPDGTKITYTSNRDGNSDIYVMNIDGTNPTNLTNNPAWDGIGSWSPDEKKIAFTSDRDGNLEIYVMNADGSEPKRLTNNPVADIGPTWSADSERIAFCSARDGNNEIYVINADGSEQERLTNNRAIDSSPSWSQFLTSEDKNRED